MTHDITIRPISNSDFAAYRELRLEALQAHPAAFGSDHAEQANDPDDVWLDRIRASIDGGKSRLFLADAAGELAGMAGIFRNNGVKVQHGASLVSVYVRPHWRGRGLATRLIGEVVAWCAGAGVRVIRLGVGARNADAIRCYLRAGFTVYGVEPESIRVGDIYHDELLMWRRV